LPKLSSKDDHETGEASSLIVTLVGLHARSLGKMETNMAFMPEVVSQDVTLEATSKCPGSIQASVPPTLDLSPCPITPKTWLAYSRLGEAPPLVVLRAPSCNYGRPAKTYEGSQYPTMFMPRSSSSLALRAS